MSNAIYFDDLLTEQNHSDCDDAWRRESDALLDSEDRAIIAVSYTHLTLPTKLEV